MKGIDISKVNRNIDFKAVKNSGIEFVIICAGYGSMITQKDRNFERNYAEAKAAGLKVGAYWVTYATTPDEAKREAEIFTQAINGKQFELPVFYDLETDPQKGYFPFVTGKENCSNMVETFCTELEKAGYLSGLFIYRSLINSHITKEVSERFELWLADVSTKLNYKGKCSIWQCSTVGRVEGIIGDVNLDICKEDFSKKIQKDIKHTPIYEEYTMKENETLADIAKVFGTTANELKKINKVKSIREIKAGDVVKVPKK